MLDLLEGALVGKIARWRLFFGSSEATVHCTRGELACSETIVSTGAQFLPASRIVFVAPFESLRPYPTLRMPLPTQVPKNPQLSWNATA